MKTKKGTIYARFTDHRRCIHPMQTYTIATRFTKKKKKTAKHFQNKTKSVHNASNIAVYWILAEISPGQRKTNSTVCE